MDAAGGGAATFLADDSAVNQLSIKKQNKQLILFAKDAVCLSGPD
jgi:hypothetical protein